MARDPGTGSPYAPDKPRVKKPRQAGPPTPSLAPVTAAPTLPTYPITLGDVHNDPTLRGAATGGGRLVYHSDGSRTVTYPSQPMTGTNDLPGLAPNDRATVKRLHDKTIGHVRPVFDALTELTGVPAVARSAVKAIEHPGIGTAAAAGANAAMLFPGLRPARVVREGADAAAAAEGAARYLPRTLTHNDLTVQATRARSRITQNAIEKPADVASGKLNQSERAATTPVVRLATTRERVVKAAGRAQRQERARVIAQQAQHIEVIKSVRAGSAEDVANFWYAQLPKSHRNAEGLKAVQAAQRQHLDYLLSGKALDDANAREQAVNAALKNAADMRETGALLKEREQIQAFKTDIPLQINDASASIGQLDGLIAKPPLVNTRAIDAVHALGQDSAQILVDAGRLNPDRVEPRKGIVSQFAGLAPTGEEAYIGHRLPTPDTRFPYTPQGGVGRPSTPKGMTSENKLVLARTGRLRPSLRVAAEDWQSVQVFHQATRARDDLGKAGVRFNGNVPADSVLVNPKGRTVPPNWKTEDLAQFTDGYQDVETVRAKAQQIVDEFSADGADPAAVDRLKQSALEQGVQWDELRVVPKRLVDRYYAQFRAKNARGTAGKAYDGLVDMVATSIIFARVGYIPKNVVQNVVMMLPHQGAFVLPNAVHAAQAMRDPELRHLLQAEVGHGAAGTLGDEALSKKILGTVANFVGKAADDVPRISAFMHEASAAGVIPKAGLLTERDKRALLGLLTDPSQRPLLNDVMQRTRDAMADFSRLTPDQSRVARRLLVIPGWLMAGTRYPFHFAATHPIRSALLAYVAMGEPGAPDRLTFNKPIDQYFTGTGFKRGIETPYGRFRTGSLSPVSTPAEIAGALVQTARGKADPYDYTHQTVFDYAQPGIGVGVQFAQGGGVKSLERLAPNYSLIHGLVSPQASSTYPEDATRLGRIKREVGVIPVRVNDTKPSGTSTSSGSPYAPTRSSGGSPYAPSRSRGGSPYSP